MQNILRPRLDILPAPQRILWDVQERLATAARAVDLDDLPIIERKM